MNDKVGCGATIKSIRCAAVLDFVPASVGAGHRLWIAAIGDAEAERASHHPLGNKPAFETGVFVRLAVMRWRLRVLSLIFLSCFSVQAQRVSFGVKGGLTALNGFSGFTTNSETRAYTLGPMVECRLLRSLAIEADVLYRRTGYSYSVSSFGLTDITRMRAHAWDVAALMKYSGSRGDVRPYVAGGLALRTFSGIAGTRRTFGNLPSSGAIVDTTAPVQDKYLLEKEPAGPTVGAGFQLKAGRLRMGPELRYTRWLSRAVNEQGSQYSSGSLFSSQNQIDFLLGLNF